VDSQQRVFVPLTIDVQQASLVGGPAKPPAPAPECAPGSPAGGARARAAGKGKGSGAPPGRAAAGSAGGGIEGIPEEEEGVLKLSTRHNRSASRAGATSPAADMLWSPSRTPTPTQTPTPTPPARGGSSATRPPRPPGLPAGSGPAPPPDAAGGGSGGSGLPLVSFTRTAPCLLPEEEQVASVRVRGPRYWPQLIDRRPAGCGAVTAAEAAAAGQQRHGAHGASSSGGRSGGSSGGGGEGTSTLAHLYRRREIFVKKKAASLPYADDPSGIRSMLSRAFQRGGAGGCTASEDGGGDAGSGSDIDEEGAEDAHGELQQRHANDSFDIVHLCNTFSADPFVVAFAQLLSALEGGGSGGGRGGGAGGGAAFSDFCGGVLYECVMQEKTGMLPWYIHLYTLAHAAAGGGGARAAALRRLCGAGAGGALPLWDLRLVRDYYAGPLATAAGVCRDLAVKLASSCHSLLGPGADAGALSDDPEHDTHGWQPLLQPVFVEGAHQLLQAAWRRMGLLPAAAASGKASPLAARLQPVAAAPALLAAVGALAAGNGVRGAAAAVWRCQEGAAPRLEGALPWCGSMVCSALLLSGLPSGARLRAALRAAKAQLTAIAAAQQQRDVGGQQQQKQQQQQLAAALAVPLLAAQLPGVPAAAVIALAGCVAHLPDDVLT
jgi:hypothetical protein